MDVIKKIDSTLKKMGLDELQLNQTIVDKALSFNVRDLDTVPDTDITKMIVGLSQYLVYVSLQINKAKIQKITLEREIEIDVVTFLATSGLSKGTKAEKRMMAVGSSAALSKKDEDLQEIVVECVLLENIDKYLEFYVNSMKKELHRREREFTIKNG